MPKRARFVRTNSVKGGPRSKGGGTCNNGPNWPCLVFVLAGLALGSLPFAAGAGFLFGVFGR